jgi:predicted DCC family thiol-disulfide oxidoreductase YuxK
MDRTSQNRMQCATVYFDGSCPLCRDEIEIYRRMDKDGTLVFADVADAGTALPSDLVRSTAMKRFHVTKADGTTVSGAEAFVSIWETLPGWRHAARVARLPGIVPLLELAYRSFLPIRPYLSRAYGRMKGRPRGGEASR